MPISNLVTPIKYLEEIAIAETNDARYIKDRILREKRKIDRLRNSIQIYQVKLLILSTV